MISGASEESEKAGLISVHIKVRKRHSKVGKKRIKLMVLSHLQRIALQT
jgi:hypothetical protein